MAKPGSERQMQYEARQKERDKEAYLKKRREQKARQRAALKKDKVRYEALKAKDRERKRQSRNPSDNPPILNSSYTTRLTLLALHYSPVAWKGCVSGFKNPSTNTGQEETDYFKDSVQFFTDKQRRNFCFCQEINIVCRSPFFRYYQEQRGGYVFFGMSRYQLLQTR